MMVESIGCAIYNVTMGEFITDLGVMSIIFQETIAWLINTTLKQARTGAKIIGKTLAEEKG